MRTKQSDGERRVKASIASLQEGAVRNGLIEEFKAALRASGRGIEYFGLTGPELDALLKKQRVGLAGYLFERMKVCSGGFAAAERQLRRLLAMAEVGLNALGITEQDLDALRRRRPVMLPVG